ncbi:uncharacterized protein LOC108157087 isoform X1 [Drosophila miranda]|uniref:uncharacterized protein LOC108157087 isoform X1 n=1 Tax=Drosophila miranda TaxID=7229 RepID=UPI00143FADCA|nr:uncharacterized protein LOC108157087 isoform X1 [Drosophila miranda]
MKTHLVLAIALCWFPLLSLADNGEKISSANMSSFEILKKLTDVTKMKCYLYWMSRLVKNSGSIVFELLKCGKQYGGKAIRVVTAFKDLVAVIKPIFESCKGVIVDAIVGGASCVKAFAEAAFSLVGSLTKFNKERSSEPNNESGCVNTAFKKYFEASSVYEVIDSCSLPVTTTTTKPVTTTQPPTDRPFYKKIISLFD